MDKQITKEDVFSLGFSFGIFIIVFILSIYVALFSDFNWLYILFALGSVLFIKKCVTNLNQIDLYIENPETNIPYFSIKNVRDDIYKKPKETKKYNNMTEYDKDFKEIKEEVNARINIKDDGKKILSKIKSK
jgi:hypothetical protein